MPLSDVATAKIGEYDTTYILLQITPEAAWVYSDGLTNVHALVQD